MDYIFIKICFSAALFGWVWVDILTDNYGLLDMLPAKYPKFLQKTLSCHKCTAGWTAILLVLCFAYLFKWFTLMYLPVAPMLAMFMVYMIKGITHE